MELYSVEQLVELAKEAKLIESLKALQGTENDITVDLKEFKIGAYGSDEDSSVWVHIRTYSGWGVSGCFTELTDEKAIFDELYKVNQVRVYEIEDDFTKEEVGSIFYELLNILKQATLQHKRKAIFVKGSTIEFISDDNYIIEYDDLVVELNHEDLTDCHPSTSIYKKFVSNITVWELIQYAAYVKNKIDANK